MLEPVAEKYLLLLGELFLVMAAFGCPSPVRPTSLPAIQTRARPGYDLPSTSRECLVLANHLGKEGASYAKLRRALRALEKAEALQGASVDLWIEQARVVFLIAEPRSKQRRVLPWLNRGQQLAKRIVHSAPEKVEGYYFTAVFVGFRAQLQEVGGLNLLPTIVENGRRAVAIDETFDDAAPLMMMGMILLQAPAWPHGIGDPEEGIEFLQRGVEVSDYPLNRLIFAKGLLLNGQTSQACTELGKVLQAQKRGRWSVTGQRYRQEAKVLFSTSRCSTFGRDP